MEDLKISSWNALSEWMKRRKEGRNVSEKASLLSLGKIVEN